MKDRFVTNFKVIFRKAFMLLFVFVAISASVSAQYVTKDLAISRLEAKSTQVSSAISNLPTTSLDYRFGLVQLLTYKSIYAEIVGNGAEVQAAVENVFAVFSSKIDSDELNAHYTTLQEYNKKKNGSKSTKLDDDAFKVIKDDVKALLK